MELIKPGTQINFMKFSKLAFSISAILIVLSIVLIATKGLNYGIDFAGGTVVQIKFNTDVKTDAVRDALAPIGLENARIQSIGAASENEFIVRTITSADEMHDISSEIKTALGEAVGSENVDIRRVEMVGSEVSEDLKQKGFLSLFYACMGILIYIWVRFELRFSIGAIMALIHDVLITVGIFSITGREVTLPVVAALLTIIGYSLNDTIVVFDRIRENMKKGGSRELKPLLNTSISQTLSRTLLTSLTTFIVVLFLFLMGGSVINNFAFAMMIGVIVGTYSSIFVASPVLLLFSKKE